MASIIWLMGLVAAGLGGWTVWNPKVLRGLLGWIQKEVAFYTTSILRASIGVIMLVWAHACHRPGVIITVGIIILTVSIALIIAPRNQTQKIVNFLSRQGQWFFRLWGIVIIAVGILIVWAGWPR
jgi:uncharacterized protein YjeT (DUF2065 family)